MNFLDSFGFALPSLEMLSEEGPRDEVVDGFPEVCGDWVVWSSHIFVVTVNVLL